MQTAPVENSPCHAGFQKNMRDDCLKRGLVSTEHEEEHKAERKQKQYSGSNAWSGRFEAARARYLAACVPFEEAQAELEEVRRREAYVPGVDLANYEIPTDPLRCLFPPRVHIGCNLCPDCQAWVCTDSEHWLRGRCRNCNIKRGDE